MPISLGADVRSYEIANISPYIRYTIQLAALYKDGRQGDSEAHMIFEQPLAPVPEFVVVSTSEIEVKWQPNDLESGIRIRPVDSYRLTWHPTDADQDVLTRTFDSDVMSFSIQNLQASTSYEINLWAVNSIGESEAAGDTVQTLSFPTATPTTTPSPTASPTPAPTATPSSTATATPAPTATPIPTPTATPSSTSTPTATSTAIPTATTQPSSLEISFQDLVGPNARVAWDLEDEVSKDIQSVELSWDPLTEQSPPMPVVLSADTRDYSIPNVQPQVMYDITVELVDQQGKRQSEVLNLMLDLPRQPVAKIDLMPSTSVKVSWELVTNSNSVSQYPVSEYEISWRILEDDATFERVRVDADTDSYLLENLLPGATYEIYVFAINSFGISEAAVTEVRVPNPTSTATPTPTPTQIQTTVTPSTPTPTSTASPIPTTVVATKTPVSSSSRSRRSRMTDPEPPTDFEVVQARDAVRLYWDQPDNDGGTSILAYAVDWTPDPPPFPMFVSPDVESLELLGLQGGTKYRARVKAFNRVDDSMPAARKIMVEHTLVRYRSYDPFTGSISYGRPIVLQNGDELPSFKLHADEKALFWGDGMVLGIRDLGSDGQEDLLADDLQFELDSSVFALNSRVESRRQRFDDSAHSYEFVSPVLICITPNTVRGIQPGSHSILMTSQDDEHRLLDSTLTFEDTSPEICARVRQLNLNHDTRFVVVLNRDALASSETLGIAPENQNDVDYAVALVFLALGPLLITFGFRAILMKDSSRPNRP